MDNDLPDGGTPPEAVEDASPSPSTTAEPPGSESPSSDPTPDAVIADAPPSQTEEPEAPIGAAPPSEQGTPEHAVDVPADLAPVEDLITEGEPASATRPLPRVIAIANQKGGVGKTTTAVNLGACLAEIGYRTLVVDLDPQGNATTGLGINTRALEASMYDVILGETADGGLHRGAARSGTCSSPRPASIWPAPRSSWSRPSAGSCGSATPSTRCKDDYDYVLIDCPPVARPAHRQRPRRRHRGAGARSSASTTRWRASASCCATSTWCSGT